MGRLSKQQISRKNAAKQGGRGKKKNQIPVSISPLPFKTATKPRTTAWRERTKAASAEQALHLAALANIRDPTLDSSYSPIIGSRPSTGHRSTTVAIGSTTSSTLGLSVGGNDSSINQEPEVGAGEVEQEEEEDDENYMNIEQLELISSPENSTPSTQIDDDIKNGVNRWPRVGSYRIKKMILQKGMSK